MSNKHTPGPWTTDCQDHDAPYQKIKVNSGYRNICTVWIDDAPVRDYNAEQESNARLIAAAPELLEALQRFVKVMDECYDYPDTSGELQRLREAANEARAAIAKAKGEQK